MSNDLRNWMAKHDDSKSLADLTIPGTHDSGALYNLNNSPEAEPIYRFFQTTFGDLIRDVKWVLNKGADLLTPLGSYTSLLPKGESLEEASQALKKANGYIPDVDAFINAPLAKAQDHSIADQLNMGVRFLDLRGRKVGNELRIYHGPIGQNQDFGQTFDAVLKFLDDNPSETVIVSTQREDGLKIAGYTPTRGSNDLGMRVAGVLPEWFLRRALDKFGDNLTQFLLSDKEPEDFAKIRPDYIEDLRANLAGAAMGRTFKSHDAQNNFYTLLRNNYHVEVDLITPDDVLGLLQKDASWYQYLVPTWRSLQDSVGAMVRYINYVVADFGLAWLEAQKESGLSASVVGEDLYFNAASDDAKPYDELLMGYIERAGKDRFYLGDTVPTLAQARGKIVLMVRDMQGERRSRDELGIDLTSKADNSPGTAVKNKAGEVVVITQDMYQPPEKNEHQPLPPSASKWQAFVDLAGKAFAGKDDLFNLYSKSALYINYLSATDEGAYLRMDIGAIGPVAYSKNTPVYVGPVKYQGLNDALRHAFLLAKPLGRYGVLVVDFIDEDMASKIVAMNG